MARGAGTGAGWFADPAGRFRFRFHDGVAWTDQVLDGRSRDEQTDTLEVELRALPPRPVLPKLTEPAVGDPTPVETAVAGFAAPASETDDRPPARHRIPRPPRLVLALLVLAGLVAGGAVLVIDLADDAVRPDSVASKYIVRGVDPSPSGTTPATGGGLPTGVTYTDDAAPPGYHRTVVDGLSIAIPQNWPAMAPGSSCGT